ncbi:DoxX family membrane protein [Actinosynnema sp. NPDC020468]|uniref:DoxX family membrane protein n=1 Tax=Actinosynnema sp. NPDC020468 TaxID=3154488 RepID=UPI0033CE3CE1
MATQDDGTYPVGGGAHHFDDGTTSFDRKTSAFDTAGYTPIEQVDSSYGKGGVGGSSGRVPFRWTGSADVGLFVLRVALGGAFVLHGLQKVFGMFGGPGIDGFARTLEGVFRFDQARVLAWVTGVVELVGGGLLVLGLFTPPAAAAVLAVMGGAIYLRWRGGFFAPDGVEREAAFAAMAFAVLFAGPGRAAFDYGRPWFRRPLPWALLCLFFGAVGAAAVLYFLH